MLWHCKRCDDASPTLIEARTASEAVEIFLSRGGLRGEELCIYILVSPYSEEKWRTIRVHLPAPTCVGAQHIWTNPSGLVQQDWTDSTCTSEHRVCRKCGWYRWRLYGFKSTSDSSEVLSYDEPTDLSRKWWIARRNTRHRAKARANKARAKAR